MADAVTFSDGGPSPKLKVKQAIRRLLAKAQKAVQGASCPSEAPAPLVFNETGVCCFDPNQNRLCGTTCCPQGTACVDKATGRCDPCPGGVGDGCPPGVGSPLCCPTARQCCTNNQCCTEGMECCGDPPICKPSFLCVQ